MKTLILTASILALGAGAAQAAGHAGIAGHALTDSGRTLVTMPNIAEPSDTMSVALQSPVRAIAYRPVTGDLLGYGDGVIYSIDPMTGTMTDLGATIVEGAAIADGAAVAFDFNNAIDAVRAVGSDGNNLVYFPAGFGDNDARANSVRAFTPVFYAAGDRNEGQTPEVFGNAYTNAIAGAKATSTQQYALDAQTNALVTLANNEGTLQTVGFLEMNGQAIDVLPVGGFDIISPAEGTDMAYAILQIDGEATAGLFSIDLSSAVVTRLADLGSDDFTGFAVVPGM